MDLHYSSLPRQAFATTLSTASGSSGGSVGTDANANPKRNVAFGNCLSTLESFINTINLEADEAVAVAAAAEESASGSSLSAKTVVIADDDGEHPLPSHRPVALPSMSASMSALTLSAALAQSNLRSLKQTSASAQNIFCSGASGSPSDTQLIDFEQDHSERATTEPPAGAADSTAGRASESGPKLAAASSPTLLDREFHQRSKSQPQPFSVSADPIQSTTFGDMRGFSVPNLGSMIRPLL